MDRAASLTTHRILSAKLRSAPLAYRFATLADCSLLASMNHQLVRDENNRNLLSIEKLAERMRGWVTNQEYSAVIFERDSKPVAYALYRTQSDGNIYLRQFFVPQEHRRQGIGTASFKLLTRNIFPHGVRVSLEVLTENQTAHRFWTAVGFRSYSITMERGRSVGND